MDDPSLLEKLNRIKKEYNKTQRKLKKATRAAKAKAHVKKILREQASLAESEQLENGGQSASTVVSSLHGSLQSRQKTDPESVCIGNIECDQVAVQDLPGLHVAQGGRTSTIPKVIKDNKSNERQVISSSCPSHNADRVSKGLTEGSQFNAVYGNNKKMSPSYEIQKSTNCPSEDDKRCLINEAMKTTLPVSSVKNEKQFTCDLPLAAGVDRGMYKGQRNVSMVCDSEDIFASQTIISSNRTGQIQKLENENLLPEDQACSSDMLSPSDTSESSCRLSPTRLKPLLNNIPADNPQTCDFSDLRGCVVDIYETSNVQTSSELLARETTSKMPLNEQRGRKKRKCASTGGIRQISMDTDKTFGLESMSKSLLTSHSPSIKVEQTSKQSVSRMSKRKLIISSIFQCLIDECRRLTVVEDFSLPAVLVYSSLMEQKQRQYLPESNNNISNEVKQGSSLQSAFLPNIQHDSEIQSYDKHQNTVKMEKGENLNSWKFQSISDSHCSRENSENCQNDESTFSESKSSHPTASIVCECSVTTGISESYRNKQKSPIANTDSISTPMSPALFDSQTTNSSSCTVCLSQSNSEPVHSQTADPVSLEVDTVGKESGLLLEQTSIFQIPKRDQIQTAVVSEFSVGGETGICIVCLCANALKFFCQKESEWSCIHDEIFSYPIRKSWNCNLHVVQGGKTMQLVLQKTMADKTHFILYSYKQSATIEISDLCVLQSKSVNVSVVDDGSIIFGYFLDQKTSLTKYKLEPVSHQSLETVSDFVLSLTTVQGLNKALVGLAKSRTIYIWNHSLGVLLTSVDIGDVCSQESLCRIAFHEQGFLFVPVISRKRGRQAGAVLVVNPQMGTSETLYPLQTHLDKWSGCSDGQVYQVGNQYLLGRENCGAVCVWDVFSGELLSYRKDTPVNTLVRYRNTVVMTHKQCIHVYKLSKCY